MPRQRDRALLAAIGARIRDLRTTRGLTQEQLAERTGIEPVTMSRVENGHQATSLAALSAMAEVLGVKLGDLVDVERRAPPPPAAPSKEEWVAVWDAMSQRQRALTLRIARDVLAG
ncbi:MAG: helix-turn-helix domain-containing protein [Myxococcota bacterium]